MAGGGRMDTPHLPTPAPIEAYGNGGFRFGGMSHRGSLLCLPDGIWAWPVARLADVNEAVLARVLACAQTLDFFLIGTGADPALLPEPLRARFRAAGLAVDAMATGPAVRTYNILLAENRRAGAGLIAVE
jgi:uncharacterized protein